MSYYERKQAKSESILPLLVCVGLVVVLLGVMG